MMRTIDERLLKASLVAAIALLASACVVAARPPPPPPPRIMPAAEAVAIATQLARSRGLVVDYTLAARLDRRGRWHVELGGAGGRDLARVLLDGYSGRVLHARLRGALGEVAPFAGPPPGGQPAPPPQPPGAEGGAAPPPEEAQPQGAPPPAPPPPPPPDAGRP